jgi:tetratricopeptide (TPR) repeat protein
MLSHVKKINVVALTLGLPLSVLAAPFHPAQNTAATPPPAGQQQQPMGSQPSNVDNAANTSQTIEHGLFEETPQQGSVGKGAANFLGIAGDKLNAMDILSTPALDNAAVGARFETYLGLPAVPDDQIKSYIDQMNQISELLKQNATFPAWKLLYSMSDYSDLDAGISRELAHRIEATWNSDKTQNGLERQNAQLRTDLDTQIHNADSTADDLHQQDLEEDAKQGRRGGGGGGNSNQNSSSMTNSPLNSSGADPVQAEASILPSMSTGLQRKMELTDDYLQTLESRANIRLNQIKEHKMDQEDQEDFASYIKALSDGHRYMQVIIAADFYRNLFNQDEYPVDMAAEVNTALESNERAKQNVQVFKFDASQGHIAGAASEVQAAFTENEFYPGLKGLDRDQKTKVGDFLDKLSILKNQIETRSFEQVEPELAQIQKIASDFDPTKPLALVNDIKLSSELRLGKAKLLAQQGELTDAMKEFQAAAEEWPGNPQLKDSANTFFGSEDTQNKTTDDFDRLVSDENYRGIAEQAPEFAAAVHGDDKREQQLKDALAKVQKAEMASEKANMLVMNGDVDGAWETIESAVNDWPDDVKLNKMLSSLSARCADFVSAINKARDAEAKKEYGYSLTWYVNAESSYPGSTIAHDGIDTVSKDILSPTADNDKGSGVQAN